MSFQLVFILVSGLILLDEYSLYSNAKLTGIAVGMGVCMLGVLFVLKKNYVVKEQSDVVSHTTQIYQTENNIQAHRKHLLTILTSKQ